MNRAWRDALVIACLLVLVLALYRKVTRLWWTFDDAYTIHQVIDYGAAEPFVSGKVWPQKLFTPLLNATFEAEFAAFDLDAERWYEAQLAIWFLTLVSIYAALRLFLTPGVSFAAVATFAAGTAACSVVTQLSTVHYLIAITLCALATIAHVRALSKWSGGLQPAGDGQRAEARRSTRYVLVAFAALLYLAALLAKEIAVSLPLVLFFLPIADRRARTRATLPYAAALLLYFLWRRALLGTFLGAYSWVIEPRDWPRLIALLPFRVIAALAGVKAIPGAVMLVAIAACIALAWGRTSRAMRWLLLAGVVAAIGPMLPVAKEVNRRYVLVPWLGCAIAFAAGATMIRDRRARAAMLCAVPLLAMTANRQEWAHEFGVRQRMSEEAHFLFDMPPNGLLRNPIAPPALMGEVNWIKTLHAGRPAGASWFYDDYYLCANDVSGKRVWNYEPRVRAILEITQQVPAIAKRHCGSIRNDAPLAVRFHFARNALHWDFGPYRDGRYTALIAEGLQAFEVPRRDALYLPGVTALPIRVRYDSPAGWTTYSPGFMLHLDKQPDFEWHR